MHTSKHVGRCCLQHLCHWPRRFHAILNLSYVFSGSDRAKLLWVWYLKTKLSSISTFNTNFFSNRIFKLSSSYYFNPARIELSGLSWAKSHGERKNQCLSLSPFHKPLPPGPDPIGEKTAPGDDEPLINSNCTQCLSLSPFHQHIYLIVGGFNVFLWERINCGKILIVVIS